MKEIISDLKTQLGEIKGIRQIFMYRDAKVTQYPAIICNWRSQDNSFESNKENRKRDTFGLYALVNVAGKSMQDIDEDIIPELYDRISEYVDENWNFGTIGGHRVWTALSLNDSGIVNDDKSKTAYLDCVLTIEYLKDN